MWIILTNMHLGSHSKLSLLTFFFFFGHLILSLQKMNETFTYWTLDSWSNSSCFATFTQWILLRLRELSQTALLSIDTWAVSTPSVTPSPKSSMLKSKVDIWHKLQVPKSPWKWHVHMCRLHVFAFGWYCRAYLIFWSNVIEQVLLRSRLNAFFLQHTDMAYL